MLTFLLFYYYFTLFVTKKNRKFKKRQKIIKFIQNNRVKCDFKKFREFKTMFILKVVTQSFENNNFKKHLLLLKLKPLKRNDKNMR